MGGELTGEGMYVYLQLTHVVQQKLSQYCKQLYSFFFFFPKEGQVGGKPECESHKEMGEAGGREEVLDWLFAYKR